MGFTRATRQFNSGDILPLSVHNTAVRNLFSNQAILLIGIASMVLGPIILYFRERDPAQLWFAAGFFALGIIRLSVGMAFQINTKHQLSHKELRFWETIYALMGATCVATLSIWYMVGFLRSSDEFCHLLSLLMTLCYLAGITGRNFSSERVVRWQVVAALVPLIVTMVIFGDVFHTLLALFLAPYFISILTMSRRLRQNLFDAVISSMENKTIADRFDAALDSVSHGIVMFDQNGRIVANNSRFAELVGVKDGSCLNKHFESLHFQDIKSVKKQFDGSLSEEPGVSMAGAISRLLYQRQKEKHLFKNKVDMVLDAGFYPMQQGMVLLLEDVSEKIEAENENLKLANYDMLTGLANRSFFMRQIETNYVNDGVLEPLALFFLDLDRFKEINDTLGHNIGDKLLISVANRLKTHTPKDSMIIRFGGDEFLLLIPGEINRTDCEQFANELIRAVSRPHTIEQYTIATGASVGIAITSRDRHDAGELLKSADAALYRAKANGRNRYEVYSRELGEQIEERSRLEQELREAVENEELEVYFQPILEVSENGLSSCEALVRWNHKTRGMVSPGEFIPIAEDSGIIFELGQLVLRKALITCKSWPDHVSVSVNVSSIQFQKPGFCNLIKTLLQEQDFPPGRLILEVTESAMLKDMNEAHEIMQQLVELGVSISLDDFGTGYSSLSHLRNLPLHKVKIDRSFVTDIVEDERSAIVLSCITRMTHELGLKVVVEGIENRQQLEKLNQCAIIDELQGFLFSRPLPPKEALDFIETFNGRQQDDNTTVARPYQYADACCG